ncbi:MAG: LemA family protein [Clostridia bacterium]|nr:LemA family protein [Clostridia bacterium]
MYANLLALSGVAIGGIVAGAVALLIIILFIVYICLKNGLVRTVNRTEESWSTIDVYLKKRYDLIPNLVNTVKGYAAHEQDTLTKVIEARNTAALAATPEEKIAAEKALSSELKTLMNFTVERYPDLKANVNFLELSAQLKNIEGDLANARKYYNANVREYNNAIMVFPSSIVAGRMRLAKKPYFELDSEAERSAVKVEF